MIADYGGTTATGGLLVDPDLEISAGRFGGTGIDSGGLVQAPAYPHRLKSGTINLMGITGLSAGIDYVTKRGLPAIHR